MKLLKKHAALIAITSFVSSGTALADPPLPNIFDGGNKWHITGYYDSSNNHNQAATQEICFSPYIENDNRIYGFWYSTSFPDWNGRYYQEGDEIKMTGDYANDVGHDHMTLLHTTYDVPEKVQALAFKDWTEWREDGGYGNIIGWGNAKMQRVGKCKSLPGTSGVTNLTPGDLELLEYEAQGMSLSLPDRLTVTGRIAHSPGQADLESLDQYKRRIRVK